MWSSPAGLSAYILCGVAIFGGKFLWWEIVIVMLWISLRLGLRKQNFTTAKNSYVDIVISVCTLRSGDSNLHSCNPNNTICRNCNCTLHSEGVVGGSPTAHSLHFTTSVLTNCVRLCTFTIFMPLIRRAKSGVAPSRNGNCNPNHSCNRSHNHIWFDEWCIAPFCTSYI